MTTTKTSHPGRSASGFSLFEILVVLVLMTLAAALVLPSFSGGLSGLGMETEARNIVTRMKQARSKAISEQKVFRILFQTEPVQAYILANEYEEPIQNYELAHDLSFVFSQQAAPELGLVRVSFFPNGQSSGMTFQIRNKQGRTTAIAVDPVTGFARVLPRGTSS